MMASLPSSDDWTPVAQSNLDPLAVVEVPDSTFELEDLRELARSLGDAGLPVLVAESPSQRRIVEQLVPIVVHIPPGVEAVLQGVAASAAWDAIKAAFARIRRRGDRDAPTELIINLRVENDHLLASAQGPAAQALAEVAQALAKRPDQPTAERRPPPSSQ
jgi:hypothetical protein